MTDIHFMTDFRYKSRNSDTPIYSKMGAIGQILDQKNFYLEPGHCND